MKTLAKIVTFFVTSVSLLCSDVRADNLINPENAVFLPKEPIPATESDFAIWINSFKSKVNNTMLDPLSSFGQHLAVYGNLSNDERTQLNYFVEVRPLANSSKIWVALFYNRIHMNRSLIRADLYSNGGPGSTRYQIPANSNQFMHESIEAARGLNLAGHDLSAFWTELKRRETEPFIEETIFYERVVLPIIKQSGASFSLIAVNVVGMSFDTLGHEINHSILGTDKEYKETVHAFWHEVVSESDREAIRQVLGGIYTAEDVIIDEFQAYLLQPHIPLAQSRILHKYESKYKAKLIKSLHARGRQAAFEDSDPSSCENILDSSNLDPK